MEDITVEQAEEAVRRCVELGLAVVAPNGAKLSRTDALGDYCYYIFTDPKGGTHDYPVFDDMYKLWDASARQNR